VQDSGKTIEPRGLNMCHVWNFVNQAFWRTASFFEIKVKTESADTQVDSGKANKTWKISVKIGPEHAF